MKYPSLLYSLLFLSFSLFLRIETHAQINHYPDHTLRMNLIWQRVADALGERGSVESVEFSPDGKYIVSGTKFDYSVIMWRTSDGAELWRSYASQEIERVGWSADGNFVASCSEDFLVQVWDAKSGELVREIPHKQGIDALIWSKKENILITGEEEIKEEVDGKTIKHGYLRVFQMPEAKLLYERDHGGTINEIMFTDDETYLLSAGHGSVKVWKKEDMSLVRELKPDDYFTFVTAGFSPDGKYLAAGGQDGIIFLWEWETGKLIRVINYTGRKIESIAWHPSGEFLVSSGHGPYLTVYRTQDLLSEVKEVPATLQVFANDGAEFIDFNADGSFLVSAHQDGVIRLWGWKGEDPLLNTKRHQWVKQKQLEAIKEKP